MKKETLGGDGDIVMFDMSLIMEGRKRRTGSTTPLYVVSQIACRSWLWLWYVVHCWIEYITKRYDYVVSDGGTRFEWMMRDMVVLTRGDMAESKPGANNLIDLRGLRFCYSIMPINYCVVCLATIWRPHCLNRKNIWWHRKKKNNIRQNQISKY